MLFGVFGPCSVCVRVLVFVGVCVCVGDCVRFSYSRCNSFR